MKKSKVNQIGINPIFEAENKKSNKNRCIQIKLRQIAILLCKNLPIEGKEFSDKVNAIERILKSLPIEAKTALKSAYIFASKVPRDEREDFFQELTLTLLEVKTKDERLAYSIARFDWIDFWKRFKTRSQYQRISLDEPRTDEDGTEHQLSEILVGECEFENQICGKIEAERIWNILPEDVKTIVGKRLQGKSTTSNDRSILARWLRTHTMQLVS